MPSSGALEDVEIVLQTSGGYDELAGVVAAVTGKAWGHGGLDAISPRLAVIYGDLMCLEI